MSNEVFINITNMSQYVKTRKLKFFFCMTSDKHNATKMKKYYYFTLVSLCFFGRTFIITATHYIEQKALQDRTAAVYLVFTQLSGSAM